MKNQYGKVIYKMEKENQYHYRYELVQFALKFGIKPASCEFKTTPKTVRKWVLRYQIQKLNGLKDVSRRPHHSPNKVSPEVEQLVVDCRVKTKNKFGALRLIERFDLSVGKSCINRIIRDHGLKKKKKTRVALRKQLWSEKKLLSIFAKIQIDVKVLTDIPLYVAQYYRKELNLPKYEFTARCVKTGAVFLCYAKKNDSIAAATFVAYVLTHLKENGIDITQITIQTDNGAEFNACGNINANTPFQKMVEKLGAKLVFIPPASPTFNSDVETAHRLVEDEFYDIEHIRSRLDLLEKVHTWLLDFNYIRKNSYRDNMSPWQLAIEEKPEISISIFDLAPCFLENRFDLYTLYLEEKKYALEVTKRTGKPDPFLDPAFSLLLEKYQYSGGYNVSGLYIMCQLILKLNLYFNDK